VGCLADNILSGFTCNNSSPPVHLETEVVEGTIRWDEAQITSSGPFDGDLDWADGQPPRLLLVYGGSQELGKLADCMKETESLVLVGMCQKKIICGKSPSYITLGVCCPFSYGCCLSNELQLLHARGTIFRPVAGWMLDESYDGNRGSSDGIP
jgi:hypothetical protein